MKYIKEYLETVVKIKPLGELTTKEDELNGLSGEMVYIDGKCSDIFISHADYANWLESKYEQKSVHKVGPKFKVGDWVVHDMSDGRKVIRQIINMTNKSYILDGEDFNTFYFNDLENDYHLWSIKDAKPGDVIAEDPIERHPSSFVAIYKKQNEEDFEDFDSYCFVGFDGKFYENEDGHCSEGIHPATTEQRDLLFQKMHESGYEWGAEKKELKKIKQNPTEWSEEDDNHLHSIYHYLRILKDESDNDSVKKNIEEHINWLSKLYQIFLASQPKQEWSDEEEDMIQALNACIDAAIKGGMNYISFSSKSILIGKVKNRLKSLKQKYTWKPSYEQITWLYRAADEAKKDSRMKQVLNELLYDLKKLKGE